MAGSSAIDWKNWRERGRPWLSRKGPGFDTEKLCELGLFEKQPWIEIEREKRRVAFEESLQRRRKEFKAEEATKRLDILMSYKHRLWHYDIDELRRLEVPAYTFVRFQELPVELQLRIWSYAARAAEPQIHGIVSMNEDEGYGKRGSSRVLCGLHGRFYGNMLNPIFYTCRNSRKVAQKISSLFTIKSDWDRNRVRLRYFNTLYDTYYIGAERWSDFKVLVDILIKLNTTRTLIPGVQNDVHTLQTIRNLAVDFNHFADTPPIVWTDFRELKTFTIILYPSDELYEVDETVYEMEEIKFVKPKRASFWGKRARWTLRSAKEVLEGVKEEQAPGWEVPEIEIMVRVTGRDYIDDAVEESLTGEEIDNDDEDEDEDNDEDEDEDEDENADEDEDEDEDEDNGEDEDDDIKWRQAATERMARKISKAEISRLKRKYHPARRYGMDHYLVDNDTRKVGDHETCSESGHDDSYISDW